MGQEIDKPNNVCRAEYKYLSQAQFGPLNKLEPSALTPKPWPPHLQEVQMINGYQINPDLDIFRQFHKHLQNMSTLCLSANIDESHPFRHALVV